MLAALDNSEFNKALGQEKSLFKLGKKKLRIIVMGMAGSGKTSLINCFYTWSRGWQCLVEFKDTLIPTKYFKAANGEEPQDIV
jgi:predicted GTPase